MRIEKDGMVLRAAEVADAPVLGAWWRDGAVMAHAGFPNGLDTTDEEIVQKIEKQVRGESKMQWIIMEVDGVPVGETHYHDKGEQTAAIGIKICVQDMQGKGHGTRFLRMLISELFENLGFERIILDANVRNIRAQRTYQGLGFREVGVN
ncbi:MAG: GNAT family N-acetyltransferase, partial [Defluviitaleaceae bacterium]|nr:GNAT family N-acetyltransferase [Defluviitaleaceae bacterium]